MFIRAFSRPLGARCALLILTASASLPLAWGQAVPVPVTVDIGGDWMARVHEDSGPRGPSAELGDYTGLPINAAARQKASTWDASILSLPEEIAKPHPAQYFMRGPRPDMRINKISDPVTQELTAYTIEGVFGRDDRVIWMDGRSHPSQGAEHTWDGYSTGVIKGNQLIITTDHMKYGVIQRNGVPSSQKGTMVEHFIRHGDFLTLVSVIYDPVYLEEPFIRTSQWVLTSNVTPDNRFLFEVTEEVTGHPRDYVPSYPLGTEQLDFAKHTGIPFEATQGGKESIYPEYEIKVKQMIAAQASGQQAAKPAAK